MDNWTILIAAHAAAASLAIPLGAFQLLRKRKGDRWHKIVGWIWVVGILVTSFTSFGIGGWGSFMELFLKALAVVSIVSVTLGIWRARQGDISGHAGFMTGAYLGLLGALVGVIAAPGRRIPTAFRDHLGDALLATAILLVIAGGIIFVSWIVARKQEEEEETVTG